MKRSVRLVIVLLLTQLWLANLALATDSSVIMAAKQEAENALQQVNNKLLLSKQTIVSLENRIAKLKLNQKELALQISQTQTKIILVNKELAKQKECFKLYRVKQSLAQKKFNDAKVDFTNIVRSVQRIQLNPPPILVVNPRDIQSAVIGVDVLATMLPKVKQKLDQFNLTLKALNTAIEEATLQQKQLEGMITEHNILAQKLTFLLQKAKQQEKNSNIKISKTQQDMEQISQQANNLEKFLTNINKKEILSKLYLRKQLAQKKLEQSTNFEQLKGKILPPINGKIIKNFYANNKQMRRGQQFEIKSDDLTVRSPSNAVVLYTGLFRSYGKMIILDVGAGYFMIISNLQKITVETDSFVPAGHKLGYASNDKLLYVELRKDSQPINLENWWQKGKG